MALAMTSSTNILFVIYRFEWGRVAILFDTHAYRPVVGASGGHLLAGTIHHYLTGYGYDAFGREINALQDFREVLLQTVGNDFASELIFGEWIRVY